MPRRPDPRPSGSSFQKLIQGAPQAGDGDLGAEERETEAGRGPREPGTVSSRLGCAIISSDRLRALAIQGLGVSNRSPLTLGASQFPRREGS